MLNRLSFRQQQILDIARQSGRVTVEDLAARFEVTPQTIRKDLNELCDITGNQLFAIRVLQSGANRGVDVLNGSLPDAICSHSVDHQSDIPDTETSELLAPDARHDV